MSGYCPARKPWNVAHVIPHGSRTCSECKEEFSPSSREAILAMEPGPEMDAMIAEKVMGWSRDTFEWVDGQTGRSAWYIENDPDYYSCSNECTIWRPSKRIEPAFEVVQHFISRGCKVSVCASSKGATCRIISPEETGYPKGGEGETVPLAISRAALLMVAE